jgi:hypothetical protein
VPVVPALAEAEAVIAMAPTLPPNSKLPDVNSSRAKPALEGLSLQLAVTFAAVPVQDVAVHGAMCGVDQEDQRPTHDSNLRKYFNTKLNRFQTISKMLDTKITAMAKPCTKPIATQCGR